MTPGYAPSRSPRATDSINHHSSHHPHHPDAALSAWNHLVTDQFQFSMYAGGNIQAPQAKYFYWKQEKLESEPEEGIGSLVIVIQTSLNVLPNYLSTFPTSSSASSTSMSVNVRPKYHPLCLEIHLHSPPALHHQSLDHSILHLHNTNMFIIDKKYQSQDDYQLHRDNAWTIDKNTNNSSSSSSATDINQGYISLRNFVTHNRALTVPHALPTIGLSDLLVMEPLEIKVVKCKYIGQNAISSMHMSMATTQQLSPDILCEISIRNVSPWMIDINRFEFLLNRSRILVKNQVVNVGNNTNNQLIQQQLQQSTQHTQHTSTILKNPFTSSFSLIRTNSSPSTTPSAQSLGSQIFSAINPTSPAASILPPPVLGTKQTTPTATPTNAAAASTPITRKLHYLPLGQFFSVSILNDPSIHSIQLKPNETNNIIIGITQMQSIEKTIALEQLLRSILIPSSHNSASHTSSLLSSLHLPYRTPFTVHYHINYNGQSSSNKNSAIDGKQHIIAQSKIV